MNILVIGGGRMGYGAAFDLIRNSPDVRAVTLADFDEKKLAEARENILSEKLRTVVFDAADYRAAVELMSGHDAAISCVNYWHNFDLTRAAIEARCHFCDLGGNNAVVARQFALDRPAEAAGVSVIPDCGLAPGMVSVLAMHGARRFENLEAIHIRVGGLPQHPRPPLGYQLIFSVEGLINEYVEQARVIRDGEIREIDSMTEFETLAFEGFPALEAFQTSGGTSTLPETFLGKIANLDYKTIRYAGHGELFKTLIALGLCSSEEMEIDGAKIKPRRLLAELLQKHLPADEPDCVLVRLEFRGETGGETARLRYDIIDRFDPETNLTAMMRTTAFPASIIAQMTARGAVARRGATPQETVIDAEKFVAELARRNIKIKESRI